MLNRQCGYSDSVFAYSTAAINVWIVTFSKSTIYPSRMMTPTCVQCTNHWFMQLRSICQEPGLKFT